MASLSVFVTLVCFAVVFLILVLYRRTRIQPEDVPKEKPADPPLPKDKASVLMSQVAASENDVGSEEEAESAMLLILERRAYAEKRRKEREQEAERQGAWMRAGTLISAQTWSEVGRLPGTIVVTSTADLKQIAEKGVDLSAEDVYDADIVVVTRGKAFPLRPN